jgi:hypothetical protein
VDPAQATEIVNKALVGGYFNDLLEAAVPTGEKVQFNKRRMLALIAERATKMLEPVAPDLECRAFYRSAGAPPKLKVYRKK